MELLQSDSTQVVSNSSSCTDEEHIFCCRWPCESHKETSMRAHPQKVEQAFMALTELDTPQVNIWGYAKHAQCTLDRKLSNTSKIVKYIVIMPFFFERRLITSHLHQ